MIPFTGSSATASTATTKRGAGAGLIVVLDGACGEGHTEALLTLVGTAWHPYALKATARTLRIPA
jgi:hypothetical protein